MDLAKDMSRADDGETHIWLAALLLAARDAAFPFPDPRPGPLYPAFTSQTEALEWIKEHESWILEKNGLDTRRFNLLSWVNRIKKDNEEAD